MPTPNRPVGRRTRTVSYTHLDVYKRQRQAHPHDDHLMPLYVALGAGGEQATRLNDEVSYGALAMDAYAFN